MQAKKSLGQNFLHNKKILEDIVRVADVSSEDLILEIGPGHGELTEFLEKRAKKVIAIEKDRELVLFLKEKFNENSDVKIIEADILEERVQIKNYKVVANIPYYITSRFIRKFLTAKNKPALMVLMVQYEVARRITAKVPDMNLLALSAQVYGKVEFIKRVSKGNFNPPPQVDSAIIKISEISDKFFKENKISEKRFFDMLHKAFGQKRKMLRATLGSKIPEKFQTKRPEELSLNDWLGILKNQM